MKKLPDDSSVQLALRLGAGARIGRVLASSRLSDALTEIEIGGVSDLGGVPGSDVMIRLLDDAGRPVRRRYSVRRVEPSRDSLTLWLTLDHNGPGTRWSQAVQPGDDVEVIGPRGKITLDSSADWHLFIGDTSGLAAFHRLAESIPFPGRALIAVAVESARDARIGPFAQDLSLDAVIVERLGRALDDPAGLFDALATMSLPPGRGRAYVFGEFHVVRALQVALLDRGLGPDDVSHKAYWRHGRANADHGEPEKSTN